MKKLMFEILAAVTILAIPSGFGFATEALPDVDAETVKGTWVSVDYEEAAVYLLKVDGAKAIVVVTKGARRGGEYVFRSDNLKIDQGNISFLAVEQTMGLKIRFTGKGRATPQVGLIEGTLGIVGSKAAFRDDKRKRTYYKGDARERLEDLIRIASRAAALAGGGDAEGQPGQTLPK
jgi:hypothetical protein